MVFTRGLNLHIFLLRQLLIIIEDFPTCNPTYGNNCAICEKDESFFFLQSFFFEIFFLISCTFVFHSKVLLLIFCFKLFSPISFSEPIL